jgi:hypothetical protein
MHNEIDNGSLQDETRDKYLRLKADLLQELDRAKERLLKELARVEGEIDVLRGGGQEDDEVPTAGVIPPIYDIQEYLKAEGQPRHQKNIIKAVGDKRKEIYPHLRHPYADVWKSLEYHNRHDMGVVCVEVKGGQDRPDQAEGQG